MSKVVKLLVVVGVGVGAWWLWQSDAAMNAVVLFCTAGVVPFSGTVLTPAQMYLFLGAVLLLAFGFVFSRRLVHDLRAVHRAVVYQRKQSPESLEATEDTPVIEPVAAPVVAAKEVPVVEIIIPGEPGALVRAWRAVSPRIRPAIGLTLRVSGKIMVRMSRRALRDGRSAIIGIYCYSIETWNRLQPYLRRFDAWLERSLKKNKDIAALLHVAAESRKSAQLWLADTYARLQRAVEK